MKCRARLAVRMRHAVALLAALVLSGCAGGSDEDQGDLVSRSWTLAPGAWAEVDLRMSAGARVDAVFGAQAPLAWDVHSHGQDGVRQHHSGTAATGTIRFEAPAAGVYSLFWENRGRTTTRLDITVTGDADVERIVP